MKLLSFAVPCYNSAAYMRRCVDSLLAGGDDLEIIIVDDGSTDSTGAIADEYQARHPGLVQAVHQANGGYGEGVNRALAQASGAYFKVLDSDDWADEKGLAGLLALMRSFMGDAAAPDLIICNYVFEHDASGASHTAHFHRLLPRGRLFAWDEIGRFGPTRFLQLHALSYRTALLRETIPQLPRHTFYTDNILAYQPLPSVRSLYYLDIPLYHYRLGRDDQTVDEKVMIRHIGEHARVIGILIDTIDYRAVLKEQPRLGRYLVHGLSAQVLVSSLMMTLGGAPEQLRMKAQLWERLRGADRGLYLRMRHFSLSALTFLPGKAGRRAVKAIYHALNGLLMLAAKARERIRSKRSAPA